MSDSPDANLQLKKRARRRLVGAVAFAGLAAVVLPMVMDEEPKQQVQDVQIRIPGQDQTPFKPNMAKPAAAPVANEKVVPQEKAETASAPAPVAKPVEVPASKPVEKKTEKPAEKKPEKPAEKKTVPVNPTETQRAAAILGDKPVEAVPSASGQYLVLIGAFSNPANVKQLQTKIGELGIKVFTESLDSPEGKKTRVRAGPFPNREAADKALDKMKRIGVNGVVAPQAMTGFDYFVITIVLVSVLLGVWRGVVGEIIALVAWVLAFFAAKMWAGEVARVFLTGIADPAMRIVAAWVCVFIVVLVLMALLRLAMRGLLKALGLTFTDRLLGVFFGLARGLTIVLVLVAVGGMTMVTKEKWWTEAYFSAPLETAVLAGKPWLPPEISKRIRFR